MKMVVVCRKCSHVTEAAVLAAALGVEYEGGKYEGERLLFHSHAQTRLQ